MSWTPQDWFKLRKEKADRRRGVSQRQRGERTTAPQTRLAMYPQPDPVVQTMG